MSSGTPSPYDASNFLVEIDTVPVASFMECVLPVASIDVIEYREGADAVNNVHKLPGLVRYGNLVLKRGLANSPNSMAIWDWFSTVVSGTGKTKGVTVTLLDSGKAPVIKWSFTNAWPVKYESPVLNGKTSALAIETLEVAVEGMTVTNFANQGA
ncbi:MAG: phage tail protein [Thaumarchaeota archaeon]|nr:phage tail protein [Nitrososphaerota archaeon]